MQNITKKIRDRKAYFKEYEKSHPRNRKAYFKEYSKKYAQTPKRKNYLKVWRQKNSEKINAQLKQWKNSNPGKIKNFRLKWLEKDGNRLHVKSLKKVRTMAERKIKLANFCELCPEDDIQPAVHRHHPDHKYPLIIVSCCACCHKWADMGEEKFLQRNTNPPLFPKS
jgi:hypothetical protein